VEFALNETPDSCRGEALSQLQSLNCFNGEQKGFYHLLDMIFALEGENI